jgi:peroxiredoxin
VRSVKRLVHTLPFALAAAVGLAQAPSAGLPLLGSCGDANDVKATIQRSDTVQVRYSLAGTGQDCYAVSVTLDGRVAEGYLLGAEHPAIADFERVRSLQPAILPYVPPPPAPPESAKPAAPAAPQPVSLAGFRAVDLNGRAVDLDRMPAKTVIVYFWSTTDRRAIKDAEMLEYVYGQYQSKSVEIVGVASTPSVKALKQICNENEAVWPQVVDSGRLAEQYHVDRAKPYLVLDRQRNVVAALSSASHIDAVLQKRLQER